MPVSPDGGREFAKTLVDLYASASSVLLARVSRRLAAGITDPGWAEAKLTEVLALRRDSYALVARLTAAVPAAAAEALDGAYKAGTVAAGGPRPTSALTRTNERAVIALATELTGTLRATHTRMLRQTEDIYRSVIADTAGPLVVGAQTRREAAATALDRFAAAGVTGYVDPAGRPWRLESYTEMATRTVAGQAHVQGGLDRWDEQGVDLLVVSDAPEECERCRPFEGAVLSRSGREPTDAEVEGHRYGGTLRAAQSAGLFHPNCRHSLARFTPGFTRPRPATPDPDGDRQRQRQRELERRIRESKRRVAALEPFGDTTALARQRALLRDRQAAIREHVAVHERKRLPARERLGAL